MLKNRIFVLLAAVGITLFALVPQSPLSTAVAIPQQINAFVAGLILVAVTAGFVWLFDYVGLDLRDFTVPISGAVSTFILATLQGWVNLIPAQYDTYVTIAFNVLVVILSGIGTLYIVKRASLGVGGTALLKD